MAGNRNRKKPKAKAKVQAAGVSVGQEEERRNFLVQIYGLVKRIWTKPLLPLGFCILCLSPCISFVSDAYGVKMTWIDCFLTAAAIVSMGSTFCYFFSFVASWIAQKSISSKAEDHPSQAEIVDGVFEDLKHQVTKNWENFFQKCNVDKPSTSLGFAVANFNETLLGFSGNYEIHVEGLKALIQETEERNKKLSRDCEEMRKRERHLIEDHGKACLKLV